MAAEGETLRRAERSSVGTAGVSSVPWGQQGEKSKSCRCFKREGRQTLRWGQSEDIEHSQEDRRHRVPISHCLLHLKGAAVV